MPNPPFLFCDTDSLAQFLILSLVRPFAHLYRAYGIRPAIVPEVEIELVSKRKWFAFKLEDRLTKAMAAGNIVGFDQGVLLAHTPQYTAAAAAAIHGEIQVIGKKYALRVHTGEAYTHAAATVLECPAMSNDWDAIETLAYHDLARPSPVLRTFDLVAFCFQTGALTLKECEQVRTGLLKMQEWVPEVFAHSSFEQGMRGFRPRLLDGGRDAIGLPGVTYPPHETLLRVAPTPVRGAGA
jgi:hypothetical protein